MIATLTYNLIAPIRRPFNKIATMKKTDKPIAISNAGLLRSACVAGIINGVINGLIQMYLLWNAAPILLSVDAITNEQTTVLGAAVPLAVTLAMILTVIAYLTIKAPKRRFLPSVLWLTIKHGIFTLGLIVMGAVLWQRLMGSVPVSLATAAFVLAVIAGLVAGMVNYMTIRASLLYAPEAAR